MTQTKTIIVLDNSRSSVFITNIEHNPTDDMEIAVSDRLDELNHNLDECSWMEVANDFTTSDIGVII